MSEWASAFSYERPRPEAEWLATPTSYSNRQVVRLALGAVGPDWEGLASMRPPVPAGAPLPDNPTQAVLRTGYPNYTDLLREGG